MCCAHCQLPVPAGRLPRAAGPAYCCFGCRLAAELARPAAEEISGQGSTLVLRLGVGLFAALNIMALNWLFYARELHGASQLEHGGWGGLIAHLELLLGACVVAALAVPLMADSLAAARLRLDQTALVTTGVMAAFGLSALNTLRGRGPLYYDSVAMLLVLVTLGRLLEASARSRALADVRRSAAREPERVRVERGGRLVELALGEVEPGDRLRVRPGECFAVDAEVVSGRSVADERRLTGESSPRAVGPGERVLGGSINLEAPLECVARASGAEGLAQRIGRLLEEAASRKPEIQRVADRVAGVFVPVVTLLALGVFAWHAADGAAQRGLFDALSVLLISCPCALGLAAPLATWIALGRAARAGVLIDSGETLERCAAVAHVCFDKTGTLSGGTLRLGRIGSLADLSEAQALALAAALESASLHPIARALEAEAAARALAVPPVDDACVMPGLGVGGSIAGRRLWLGGERLVKERGLEPPADFAREGSATRIYLGDAQRVLAGFELEERPREDAAAALAALRALGVGASVLTGDSQGPAERLARELGLEVEHGLLPAGKLERLSARRARAPGSVAMVGDGINDAPVLAAADVGFALGDAADLAKLAGNVRLIGNRLDRVPFTLALARAARSAIRRNLAWAFAYNSLGLALAATGRLSPIVAALAMIGSSLTVVWISRGAGRLPARAVDERPGAGAPRLAGLVEPAALVVRELP